MKQKIFKTIISLMLIFTMLFSMGCNSNTAAVNETTIAKMEIAKETKTVQETDSIKKVDPTQETKKLTHKIVDHAGYEIKVPNEINNIVVSDIYPMVSVLSIFFDGADKIVGMAAPSMSAAKNSILSKLYPELLNAKTDFVNGAEINVEELLKLNPDVIFYSESSKQEGELLRSLGLNAVAISVNKWNYNAIETLNNWIDLLSQIFPENNKSEICKQYSNEVLEDVQNRVKDIPDEDKRKAFFLFQYNDTSILTSGKNFFGNWWAEAIGAKNVASELEKDNSVAVNMEQIYSWNPDLIFITNFNQYKPDDLFNNTVASYDWSGIKAIQDKEAYKMPLGMYRTYTPGIDTPITLYFLAKCAYPEKFEDINISEKVKDYYKTVFNIELTDEEVDVIFNPKVNAGVGFANGK